MLVWLSLVAFAVALGRAFFDWGIVAPEMGRLTDPTNVLVRMLVYSAVFGAWAWALTAIALGQRRGVWVALIITLLASVALGLATTVVLCPTPCPTLWPVGEIWNWATTLTGLAAAVAQVRAVRRHA